MEQEQTTLSQAEMLSRVLPVMDASGQVYRKKKNVFARKARLGEQIETFTSDGKETVNTAGKGDYIVENQTEAKELYILPSAMFQKRYEFLRACEGEFDEFRPLGKVIAVEMNAENMSTLNMEVPFSFMAAWGEAVVIKPDDFLVCLPDFSEVYRIAHKEFEQTYVPDNLPNT